MPLPDFLSTSNTFRQWLATTNNLTSHVDNTSVYLLVSQNATPRLSTGNISVNGTITLNTTTLNTTAYTGTASNATNLNSQPASYYVNTSNFSTGTLAIARLDANVLLTTSSTGINASALSTGTVANARLDSNIIFTTSTTGINATALSTGTVPDGRLSGTYTNITANNATYAFGKLEGVLNVNSAVTANQATYLAGITVSGNSTALTIGANVYANTTTVFLGNSTSNTVITGGNITINGISVLTGLDPVVAAIALG